jgi:serine/threonine-protein kinase
VNPHGGPGEEASGSAPAAKAPKACPSCGASYPADALFCSLDGSPLTTSPGAIAAAAANDYYVGREILGHIEIRQLVGLGAMGRVYRAFQRGIDRDVAVKILHRELSANPAVVARFNREAKVAARLSHPNVVHVLLVGQLPDGAMYIVMEYLDGMSLQSALAAAGGALPLPRALHIAVQLCDAAGEAHGQGIVHRDLKPENVMLIERADDPDFVKVLDFGIARLSSGDQGMATAAGLVFGTARYISPEGAGGEKVGPQGDVYSIATMVYQMLAGRTPFEADQAVALLVQQIHDAPASLKGIARASYVPDPIASVIMRNLSKKPDDRAESGRAFGRALLEAAMKSGLSAQDILARPSLQPGGRGSPGSVQMPSMLRTKQLTLDPGTVERIGTGTQLSEPEPPATKTVVETPEGAGSSPGAETRATGRDEGRTVVRTEIGDNGAPPGVATAKWTPPPALAVQAAVASVARATTPPSKPPSSVDATLIDEQAPLPSVRQPAATTTPAAGRDADRHQRPLVAVLAALALAAAVVAVIGYRMGSGPVGERSVGGPAPAGAALSTRPHEEQPGALPPSVSAGAVDPLPPLVNVTNARTSPPGSASVGARVAVAIEASSARPGVGEPVDLSARVMGAGGARPKVDGAKFRIKGPGIVAGTELAALDDGTGVLRTTFTFLQPGRYEVGFSATADGVGVRSARVLVVDDPSAPAAAPAPPAAPASATSGNPAKWL